MSKRAADDVFTPRDVSGERLTFVLQDVEVLSGSLDRRGPGEHATVRINGQTFRVLGADCGADCYCDAVIERIDDPYRWDTSVERLEIEAGIIDDAMHGFDYREAWDADAEAGRCDARGGAEYRRWLVERIDDA